MFKKIIIVFLLYIIYTLLFTDFTHLRKPNVEILKEQAADVKSGYNKFVDYVDNTVIPKVDTFFEEKGDENLVGTIVDGLMKDEEFKVDIDIPSLQIEKEPMIREDTFFNEEEK